MARAMVTTILNTQNTGEGTLAVNMEVSVFGADVPGMVQVLSCQMKLSGQESAQQMRTKLTDCVVETTQSNGLTVARGDCLVPSWDRGV